VLRGGEGAAAGALQQRVETVRSAQPVVEERQGAPVGLADVFVQTFQVFGDAVEFPQAAQAAFQTSRRAFGVMAGRAFLVPVEQAIAMLGMLDVAHQGQHCGAAGQRMVGIVELRVIADEELGDVALEQLAGELRGAAGLDQFGHQVAYAHADRCDMRQQAAGLVGGFVQCIATCVVFHHLAQQEFHGADLGTEERGAPLGEIPQRPQQQADGLRHGSHFAHAHALLA